MMAASAANLTSTVRASDDDDEGGGRPSVFELVSQQGFSHALKPAFFHIVKTLAERFPEGHIPMFYRNFDEFYLAFDSLVQWHYFLTRGATLSEAFYGLERKTVSSNNGDYNSQSGKLRLSFVLTVVLPYIHSKLEKAYDEQHNPLGDESGGELEDRVKRSQDIKRKVVQLFLKYYPYIKTGISFLNLIYLLKYAFGYSKSHDVLFRLLGLRFAYMSPERSKMLEGQSSELFQLESWRNLKRLPILVLRMLGESVLFGVEMGSFFVQFLNWWYNDPRRERVVVASLPVPPPPSPADQNCVVISSKEMNKCPLCRRPFRNPTAISTSGIVYCYSCIVPHLKQDGKCPLTRLRFTMDNLIRIYS